MIEEENNSPEDNEKGAPCLCLALFTRMYSYRKQIHVCFIYTVVILY